MKKIILIFGLLIACSFAFTSTAQSVYPTGRLAKYVIFISVDWEVVILVTCEAPHDEYCTNTPRDKSSNGETLVKNLNKVIGNNNDWEIKLVESDSQKRVYMYTPKKGIFDETKKFKSKY